QGQHLALRDAHRAGLEPADRVLHDRTRDAAVEVPVTAGDCADRLDQLARLRALDQVAGCAGGKRLADGLVVAVHRQDDDAKVGLPRPERAKKRDRIALRKRQVEEQDGGMLRDDELDRGCMVCCLADDLETRFTLEDQAQPFTDQVVVIDERDPDDTEDTVARRARRGAAGGLPHQLTALGAGSSWTSSRGGAPPRGPATGPPAAAAPPR